MILTDTVINVCRYPRTAQRFRQLVSTLVRSGTESEYGNTTIDRFERRNPHVTLAFVNPGEQVLVPNPGYPTYTSLSKILGAEVINYDLKEEDGWMPDFEALEKMDLSRVKLMWTNYEYADRSQCYSGNL